MLLELDQEEEIQLLQHLQITCHGIIQVEHHRQLLLFRLQHHFIITIKLFQSMGMSMR